MYIEKPPVIKEHKEGIKYDYPGDAIALFSTPRKLHHFFVFLLSKLSHWEVRFINETVPMMPCVYFQSETRAKEEFFAIDYLFFLKTVADYIHEYELGNPYQFIDDFMFNKEYNDTKMASLFLFSCFFEQVLRVAYVNGIESKTQAKFLQFATNAIYKNDRVAIEFAAINFKFKDIFRITENENLVKEMKRISQVSGAKQQAYGIQMCNKYWTDNKKKPVYFMAKEDVKIG